MEWVAGLGGARARAPRCRSAPAGRATTPGTAAPAVAATVFPRELRGSGFSETTFPAVLRVSSTAGRATWRTGQLRGERSWIRKEEEGRRAATAVEAAARHKTPLPSDSRDLVRGLLARPVDPLVQEDAVLRELLRHVQGPRDPRHERRQAREPGAPGVALQSRAGGTSPLSSM